MTAALDLECSAADWRGTRVSRYLAKVDERVGTGRWGMVDWDAYRGLELEGEGAEVEEEDLRSAEEATARVATAMGICLSGRLHAVSNHS